MRVNVEKVLERDQKLSELDDRAGNCVSAFVARTALAPCDTRAVRLTRPNTADTTPVWAAALS